MSAFWRRVWRGWCIIAFDYDPWDNARLIEACSWKPQYLVAVQRVRELENALLGAQYAADRVSSDINAALYRAGDADEP